MNDRKSNSRSNRPRRKSRPLTSNSAPITKVTVRLTTIEPKSVAKLTRTYGGSPRSDAIGTISDKRVIEACVTNALSIENSPISMSDKREVDRRNDVNEEAQVEPPESLSEALTSNSRQCDDGKSVLKNDDEQSCRQPGKQEHVPTDMPSAQMAPRAFCDSGDEAESEPHSVKDESKEGSVKNSDLDSANEEKSATDDVNGVRDQSSEESVVNLTGTEVVTVGDSFVRNMATCSADFKLLPMGRSSVYNGIRSSLRRSTSFTGHNPLPTVSECPIRTLSPARKLSIPLLAHLPKISKEVRIFDIFYANISDDCVSVRVQATKQLDYAG